MAKSPKSNKNVPKVKSVDKIKAGKQNLSSASPKIQKSPKKPEAAAAVTAASPKTPKNKLKSPKSLTTVKDKKIKKPEETPIQTNSKARKLTKKEKINKVKQQALEEAVSQIPTTSTFASDLAKIKEQSKKAFESVLKFTQTKKATSLFPDLASRISLDITCILTPSIDMQFFNIRLPHKQYPESADVVLVIKHDKKGQEDYQEPELKAALYKQKLLTEHGIKLREVITLQQLRKDYSTFEARRAFIKRIDCLLVDKSIVKHIPGILGRDMYKKKTFPIAVSFVEGRDPAKEIAVAMRKSVLNVSTKGKCSTVVIGSDELTSDQLVENLEKVVRSLKKKFPGGWNNINKLSINALGLPQLVIHFSTRYANVTKSLKKSRGRREIVEDEISTQLNKRIKIYPDGLIEVTKVEDSD